jgi:hypothetical protein
LTPHVSDLWQDVLNRGIHKSAGKAHLAFYVTNLVPSTCRK